MKKPKIYIDKHNDVIIIFPKEMESKSCHATLIHDRGVAMMKETNIFGDKLSRYIFHCANAYGDSGYSSDTNNSLVNDDYIEYKLIKKGV